MLLLIVIIILIACAWILWNIYFNFFSFQQNFQDINNYYNSYYGVVSSIERWLLSNKYFGVWYQWSAGYLWTWTWWNMSDTLEDGFWNFTRNNNWIYRSINSKTTSTIWKINYNDITTIILTMNTWSNEYWYDTTISKFFEDDNYIWLYIKNNFEPISLEEEIQLKWNMVLKDWKGNISARGDWNEILNNKLNDWTSVKFSKLTYDIFNSGAIDGSGFDNDWKEYSNIWDALVGLNELLIQFYITWEYLKTNNWIVPYLDFTIKSNIDVSDLYYYITGTSIVWNYKKDFSIKKPTSNYKNPNRKSFIFPYYN